MVGYKQDIEEPYNRYHVSPVLHTGGEAATRLLALGNQHGLMTFTLSGQVIYADDGAERILGMPCTQLAACASTEPVWAIFSQAGLPIPDDTDPFAHVLHTGHASPIHVIAVQPPDGALWHIAFRCAPVYDAAGQLASVSGTLTDITDCMRAMEDLHKRETQFRTIIETLLDGFAILSTIRDDAGRIIDFRYEYLNEAGCQLHRLPREEQLGRTLLALMPAYRENGTFDEYVRVVESGEPLYKESLVYADTLGSEQHVTRAYELRAVRLGDGLATTWRDVTQQKQTEDAKWRLAAIVESSNDAIICQTLDGKIVNWNQGARQMFGYDGEEVYGKPVSDLLPAAYAAELPALLAKIQHGMPVSNHEAQCVRKNGTRADVSLTISPVCDAATNIVAYSWVIRDISSRISARNERDRLLAEVTRQAAELHATLTSLADGLVIYDTEGRVVQMNESAQHLIGDLPGQRTMPMTERITLMQIVTEDGSRFPVEELPTMRALRRGLITQGIIMGLHHPEHHSFRWVSVSAAPIHTPEGELLGAVATYIDITERKRAEEERQLYARQQAVLAELGQHALVGMSLEAIVSEALIAITDILHVEYAELFAVDYDEMQLRLQAGAGWSHALIGQGIPLSEIPQVTETCGMIDASETTCPLVKDIREFARLHGHEVTEGLFVVIQGLNRPFGIVGVHTDSPRSFTPVERTFLQSVANVLGAVIEKTRFEKELRYLSTHDTLTGLYNRAFFEEELTRLERGRQYPISIIVADVDRLKLLNDTQGHAAGDDLLKRTQAVLRRSFRADEIVARIGGDEFVVLLPGMDAEAAQASVARIRRLLAEDNAERGEPELSLSIGTATGMTNENLHDVLKKADALMYQSKRTHGKQRAARM